jgi:hypothetical protein
MYMCDNCEKDKKLVRRIVNVPMSKGKNKQTIYKDLNVCEKCYDEWL